MSAVNLGNCSGRCCVCVDGYTICKTDWSSDGFRPATAETIIERIESGAYNHHKEYMVEYLKDKFNYIYKEK